MANWRMIPPGVSPSGVSWNSPPVFTIQNRSYSVAIGSTVDVPDFDGAAMRSNGWIVLGVVGTTAQRTASANIGLSGINTYVDTTLGYAVFWDGQTWRDTSGVLR